jgi:hypothetical protein
MNKSQMAQKIRRLPKEKINKLTERIIGLGIKVHRYLGPGFVEKIYEKALSYEFKKGGLDFVNQAVIKVKYEDLELGNQRVGLILNFGRKSLEIKRMVYKL